jgi:hypothetical protein
MLMQHHARSTKRCTCSRQWTLSTSCYRIFFFTSIEKFQNNIDFFKSSINISHSDPYQASVKHGPHPTARLPGGGSGRDPSHRPRLLLHCPPLPPMPMFITGQELFYRTCCQHPNHQQSQMRVCPFELPPKGLGLLAASRDPRADGRRQANGVEELQRPPSHTRVQL